MTRFDAKELYDLSSDIVPDATREVLISPIFENNSVVRTAFMRDLDEQQRAAIARRYVEKYARRTYNNYFVIPKETWANWPPFVRSFVSKRMRRARWDGKVVFTDAPSRRTMFSLINLMALLEAAGRTDFAFAALAIEYAERNGLISRDDAVALLSAHAENHALAVAARDMVSCAVEIAARTLLSRLHSIGVVSRVRRGVWRITSRDAAIAWEKGRDAMVKSFK